MQYYYPQAAQFAPQGYWGDRIAGAAPIVGGLVGGGATVLTENPIIGGLAGGLANVATREFGEWLPYSAFTDYMPAPVMMDAQRPNSFADPSLIPFGAQQPMAANPAFAPQGAIAGWLGRTLGGAVGGHYGQRGLGEALGGFAGGFLPFQAGPGMAAPQPQFAPQGRWGNFIRDVAPVAGRHVGGNWGRAISTVGSMADMLPFQAGPEAYGYPQEAYVEQPGYAPQGIFGSMLGGAVGGMIGKRFGSRGLGSAIGGIAGGFLPFQAGPGMAPAEPQFAPQGRWGNFIRDVAPIAGRHAGGNWGRAISTVGSMADMLPFQAGPEAYGYAPEAYPTEAAFAPQGAIGSWLGRTVGGAVGGRYGHRGLGQAIGGFAGNLLPFQAGPEAYGYAPEAYAAEPSFAPQGAIGSWLGRTVGGAVGGRYGHRGLGQAIGGFAGNLLPFQAGPEAYGYAYPQGEQIVYH